MLCWEIFKTKKWGGWPTLDSGGGGDRGGVSIATRYELDSSGLNPGGSKRFSVVHTFPHQLRSLPNLLYNGQKCSFPGVKLQTYYICVVL
jgi:hypothetical protein